MSLFKRNPLLSPRPKALQIHMGSLKGVLQQREAPMPRSFMKRIGQSVVKRTGGKSEAVMELDPIILDILPKLTGVTELSIIYKENDPPSYATMTSLIFAGAWKAFGDRLRSLSIHSSTANLGTLLPTSLRLPSLEIFSVETSVSTDTTEIVATTLIPFLVTHQSSLRQISIRINQYHLEVSSIFRCLQDMPCLHGISIQVGVPPNFFSVGQVPFNGYSMLMAHQQNLKSFALYFPYYPGLSSSLSHSAFFCQDWCHLKLPNLRDLTIEGAHTELCKEFFDYIHLFASSLVTLTISGYWISYKEARRLGRKLADFRSLGRLTLDIHTLSPSILAVFAQALPGLSHLVFRYHSISIVGDGPWARTYELSTLVSLELHCNIDRIHNCTQFSRDMQFFADLFSRWELESFDFGAGMAVLHNPKITKILLDFLPNVVWFCEIEREECIRICSNSGI